MLLRVVADGRTRSLGNALHDCHSLRFDIAFLGICAETKHEVAIPRVLVKFGSFKVLVCQFGTFCLSFRSVWI